jgi:glycosidase
VNVTAQDADPTSLLALYRRLIHLRASNDALATGELVPLQASEPHVAAYLRHAGDRAVLVVANVGGSAVSAVSLSSGPGALAQGEYQVSGLMGNGSFAALHADQEGRIASYAPLATALAPHATLVLDLVRRRE